MAPLPPVNKVIHVRLIGHMTTGVPWGVGDYYRYGGQAPTPADMNQFCADIMANAANYLLSHWQGDTDLTEVTAVDLTAPTAAVGSFSASHSGTAGGNELADSVCVVESKPGAMRYRGGHPRTYWPALGGTGANQDGRTWNSSFLSSFNTALTNYRTGLMALQDAKPWGPITWCVVHYKGSHPGITYPFVENITTSSLDPLFGTQRRRLGR